MTKKDYILIAKVLKQSTNLGRNDIAKLFAEAFSNENPLFDDNKFFKAIGMEYLED